MVRKTLSSCKSDHVCLLPKSATDSHFTQNESPIPIPHSDPQGLCSLDPLLLLRLMSPLPTVPRPTPKQPQGPPAEPPPRRALPASQPLHLVASARSTPVPRHPSGSVPTAFGRSSDHTVPEGPSQSVLCGSQPCSAPHTPDAPTLLILPTAHPSQLFPFCCCLPIRHPALPQPVSELEAQESGHCFLSC